MARKRVVIVGGVAGGASCAAHLRRLNEDTEIVILDRGYDVSLANCGLPYFVGNVIQEAGCIREIWINRGVGQRAYYACRILSQQGFRVRNLSGGYHTYRARFPEDRMQHCRAEANVTSTCNR